MRYINGLPNVGAEHIGVPFDHLRVPSVSHQQMQQVVPPYEILYQRLGERSVSRHHHHQTRP